MNNKTRTGYTPKRAFPKESRSRIKKLKNRCRYYLVVWLVNSTMMFSLQPLLILAILAPKWAAVHADNVTAVYVYPTAALGATLNSENGYKIDWTLNPNCPQPAVDHLRFNCTKGSLDSNLATTVAALKIVPPEAPPITDDTENEIPTNSWIWSLVMHRSPALMVTVRFALLLSLVPKQT